MTKQLLLVDMINPLDELDSLGAYYKDIHLSIKKGYNNWGSIYNHLKTLDIKIHWKTLVSILDDLERLEIIHDLNPSNKRGRVKYYVTSI